MKIPLLSPIILFLCIVLLIPFVSGAITVTCNGVVVPDHGVWYSGVYNYVPDTQLGYGSSNCVVNIDGGASWTVAQLIANRSTGTGYPSYLTSGSTLGYSGGGTYAPYPNSYQFFKLDSDGNNHVRVVYIGGSDPRIYKPIVSYTVTPLTNSGFPPVNATFTDTSTGTPTSWGWWINNGTMQISTSQNPPKVLFTMAGTWTVNHSATNSFGTNWTNQTYIVKSYNPPIANFTASPVMGVAPLTVQFTDTSQNIPTQWQWSFDTVGLGVQILPSPVNTTQNPVVQFPYSGVYTIYLHVINPAGDSQLTRVNYIQVNGSAPVPSPSPTIPFPNSSPVCGLYAQVTQGSGNSQPFPVNWMLTLPTGSQISGSYPMMVTTTQPEYINTQIYNANYGVYIYQETNNTGTLLYRSSYTIVNCTATSTATPTPTVPYTYPVTYVTIPPVITSQPYPTALPTGVVIPTIIPNVTVPATIAPVPTIPTFSGNDLYNYTITISPGSYGPTTFMRDLINAFSSNLFSPLTFITSPLTNTSTGFVTSFTMMQSLLVTFGMLPVLFVYAFGALVSYMPVKVQLIAALVLWSNNVFFLYDRYQGKVFHR